MVATALLLGILVWTALAVGYPNVQAQKALNQKENDTLVNAQSFYLYNESYPFDPVQPTGIFFANESNLQLFISSLPQGSSYVGVM